MDNLEELDDILAIIDNGKEYIGKVQKYLDAGDEANATKYIDADERIYILIAIEALLEQILKLDIDESSKDLKRLRSNIKFLKEKVFEYDDMFIDKMLTSIMYNYKLENSKMALIKFRNNLGDETLDQRMKEAEGFIKYYSKKYEDAIKIFNNAESNSTINLFLMLSYYEIKEYDKVREYYGKLSKKLYKLDIVKGYSDILLNKIEGSELAGDYLELILNKSKSPISKIERDEENIKKFENFLNNNKDFILGKVIFSDILSNQEKWEEALDYINNAIIELETKESLFNEEVKGVVYLKKLEILNELKKKDELRELYLKMKEKGYHEIMEDKLQLDIRREYIKDTADRARKILATLNQVRLGMNKGSYAYIVKVVENFEFKKWEIYGLREIAISYLIALSKLNKDAKYKEVLEEYSKMLKKDELEDFINELERELELAN